MEEKYNIKQLLIYVAIILITLGVFYGITILLTNKQEQNQESNNYEVEIDYDTILAKDILSQSREQYYVFASTSNDENLNSYLNQIYTYQSLDDSLKVYEVDLDSAFNKSYMGSESSFETKIIFKQTTLLKVENKKVTEVYESQEDIDAILKLLTSEE